MKVFFVACLVALAALAAADDYILVDKFDYKGLMDDEPKWKAAFKCILGQADCGDLTELKEATVKRLKEKCGSCTTQQREKYDSDLKAMKEKYPEDYAEMSKLYNPY